jgi:hypothetical protein
MVEMVGFRDPVLSLGGLVIGGHTFVDVGGFVFVGLLYRINS